MGTISTSTGWLDGLTRVKDLVKYTKELGHPATCISDHGVMFSLPDLVKECKEAGQRYVIAMEAYVVFDHMQKGKNESEGENTNTREHLLLIAQNEIGYKNLMKLASISATEGFYYRPRISENLLYEHREGLIATSTCLGSKFSQLIVNGKIDEAKEQIKKYAEWFEDRFYIEIQPTKEYLQKIANYHLVRIAKELNIPILVTTDAHYLKREDSETHDVLLSMQSGSTVNDPNRWRFPGDTFFVPSRREMFDLFFEDCEAELDKVLINQDPALWKLSEDDIIFTKTFDAPDGSKVNKIYIKFKHGIDPEVIIDGLDNSLKILDTIDLEVKWDKVYLPEVEIPENPEFQQFYEKKLEVTSKQGKQPETKSAYYLRWLAIRGLKNKSLTSPEYKQRLEYELDVINSMGFPDYFLLLEDVVSFCNENDIAVGPGRGCFLPDQKITILGNKTKKISNIKKGDIVLTHKGHYRKVQSVQKYHHKEKIAILTFEALNGRRIEIRSTDDHEFYMLPKHYERDFKNVKWVAPFEMKIGDFGIMPLPKPGSHTMHIENHERCLACHGKKSPDWLEQANKEFHDSSLNSFRVIEKTVNNITYKLKTQDSLDDTQVANLERIKYELQGQLNVMGIGEVSEFETPLEEFAYELEQQGYELATLINIEYMNYIGPVYDLTVEVDSSYVVNDIAVHNSAAGSLVSYAIGLTNVDPIKYNLLFERFLNPKRGKLPKQYWASKVNLARGCAA